VSPRRVFFLGGAIDSFMGGAIESFMVFIGSFCR
jgi:hypothetical protein